MFSVTKNMKNYVLIKLHRYTLGIENNLLTYTDVRISIQKFEFRKFATNSSCDSIGLCLSVGISSLYKRLSTTILLIRPLGFSSFSSMTMRHGVRTESVSNWLKTNNLAFRKRMINDGIYIRIHTYLTNTQ